MPGGAAKCWGRNKKGLLGNGTTTDSSSPVSSTGFGNVVVLSVGPDFSCALLVSGTVQCVGDRWGGKLGDGSFAYRPTPAVVPNISATQAVSGSSHMCVLVAGGTVKCWGYNVYGQLGDGSQSDRQLPVVVAGLTNVTAVSNGEHFSCAVITGGTVKCWGYNGYGQLGDGTDVNRSTPRQRCKPHQCCVDLSWVRTFMCNHHWWNSEMLGRQLPRTTWRWNDYWRGTDRQQQQDTNRGHWADRSSIVITGEPSFVCGHHWWSREMLG